MREVTVKIRLKQEEEEKEIIIEALLDSDVTELVMSLEFARKNKFEMRRLERPIYMRNVDETFKYKGHTVEVELFFKGYKERTLINVIGGQKWSVILVIL